ncbi:hypothetical protein [Microbacterium sp.]|uniref:Mom family adenine methylcarbamoylation protein n=1 Tax=Microbacterium sp. TaxID=51671 RepID=UPI0039E5CE41
MSHLRAVDYYIEDIPHAAALDLVQRYHYAKGGSNTAVFRHGLFRAGQSEPVGVAWWLPPTKPAAVSVAGDGRKGVLVLTRLVVAPEIPTNGASFLLGRSIRRIRQNPRWTHLVTYADEGEGHLGQIYRATNWEYQGAMRGHPGWVDKEGRRVSVKAATNRTYEEMEEMGLTKLPASRKHKFTMDLRKEAA